MGLSVPAGFAQTSSRLALHQIWTSKLARRQPARATSSLGKNEVTSDTTNPSLKIFAETRVADDRIDLRKWGDSGHAAFRKLARIRHKNDLQRDAKHCSIHARRTGDPGTMLDGHGRLLRVADESLAPLFNKAAELGIPVMFRTVAYCVSQLRR